MGIGEICLLGVGLSMDAFAVSICKGLQMRKFNWKQALWMGIFFGGFQALMPVIRPFIRSGIRSSNHPAVQPFDRLAV